MCIVVDLITQQDWQRPECRGGRGDQRGTRNQMLYILFVVTYTLLPHQRDPPFFCY